MFVAIKWRSADGRVSSKFGSNRDMSGARLLGACLVTLALLASAGAPTPARAQANFDRPGGDYRNFEIKSGEGDEPCKAACVADNKCRAWTYARPGYVGRAAHCFLKKDIKPPRRKAGFISGVVR